MLRRKPDLSVESFQRYWRDNHGPLVASLADELNILRYVQVHAVEGNVAQRWAGARGTMEPHYDGMAQLWWESEEAFAAGNPQAAQRLDEDEARFVDLPGSPLWLAHEYPQVNPNPEVVVASVDSPILKVCYSMRPPREIAVEDAQRYWHTQHGPLIRRHAAELGILRYMQVHRFESSLESELREAHGTVAESYMGHAEVWLDESLLLNGPAGAYAADVALRDERQFIDFSRSSLWLGKEHVIVDRL